MIYINSSLVDKVFFKEQDISCYTKDVLIYPYISDSVPFTLEFTTTAANQKATLPCANNVNVTVDWGDGSPAEKFTKDRPSHTYNSAGVHTVKVIGDFEHMFCEVSDYITKIVEWGNTNTTLKNMSGALGGCEILTSIPTDKYGAFKNVTNFTGAFSGCNKLTNIPDGLFNFCTKVNTFAYLFNGSTGLTSSIPTGLFDNCPLVTTFTFLFANCTKIYGRIPDGLFDNCPLVTEFNNAFSECNNLSGDIPIRLFDKNTKVTTFYDCFSNCSGLTGTVPYDSLGGTQTPTPLYQRSEGVNGYVYPKGIYYCFKGCTGLSDYASIPNDWK